MALTVPDKHDVRDVAGYRTSHPRSALWQAHLPFGDDRLHAFPQLRVELAGGRYFEIYQLASGHWHLGARAADTGAVLWVSDPPRALHGTDVEMLTATQDRLYVVMSSRLEVFDAATGTSLGVVW